MRPRATSRSTETSMLAFLEGGVQQERVVRVAWPERVSLGRPAVGKGLGPWRVWPLWRPGQAPHLISWAGFLAFRVLKMSVSCSSRCLSCSHVESLLQMKDSGHSLNTLGRRGEGWASGSSGVLLPAREGGPSQLWPISLNVQRGRALVAPNTSSHTPELSGVGTWGEDPGGQPSVGCGRSRPSTGNARC